MLLKTYPLRPLCLLLMMLLAACQQSTHAPTGETGLKGAGARIVTDLKNQLGFSLAKRSVAVDPMLDSRTGQQTEGSLKAQQFIEAAFRHFVPEVVLMPLDEETVGKARLVMSGVLTGAPRSDTYRLSVSLADRASGLVVAQAVAQFTEAGLSQAPTAFYRESPSTVRDRSVQGYVKTADTPKGSQADALYIQQIPTAAVLAEALAAYNEQRWEDALAKYEQAAQRPEGQQLRTFNGIYLANVELGRMEAAEVAFSKIVALGLATNNLAVKILFKPGTTEFWPDQRVSRLYPMWLRQIAVGMKAANGCLRVVGHTSASGTDAVNQKLSLNRAAAISASLIAHDPSLAQVTKVAGVGSNENIVGSGADDASDAIDRRVEFQVIACE